ncbi:MAG: HPr family phosphocarrier protein [Lachnospiraceae bacterium]|nr:HPr family phosphocarrier protein [Lachnospiraceae bacterium]
MISAKVTIQNSAGLHLRPAGVLCKKAMEYKCRITFRFRGITGDAKSILSVLGACVKKDSEIEFFFDGADEKEAMEALVQTIESGLGE